MKQKFAYARQTIRKSLGECRFYKYQNEQIQNVSFLKDSLKLFLLRKKIW